MFTTSGPALGVVGPARGEDHKIPPPRIWPGEVILVAAELGVTVQEVQAAADFIRTLDPKPTQIWIGPGGEL